MRVAGVHASDVSARESEDSDDWDALVEINARTLIADTTSDAADARQTRAHVPSPLATEVSSFHCSGFVAIQVFMSITEFFSTFARTATTSPTQRPHWSKEQRLAKTRASPYARVTRRPGQTSVWRRMRLPRPSMRRPCFTLSVHSLRAVMAQVCVLRMRRVCSLPTPDPTTQRRTAAVLCELGVGNIPVNVPYTHVISMRMCIQVAACDMRLHCEGFRYCVELFVHVHV